VGRILRLTERYHFSAQFFVQPRTLPAAALAATLGRILNGLLPGPLDTCALFPPVGAVWVRRVLGQALWLYYDFDDVELTVHDVRNREPILLDD
jgi:hypothetical protein